MNYNKNVKGMKYILVTLLSITLSAEGLLAQQRHYPPLPDSGIPVRHSLFQDTDTLDIAVIDGLYRIDNRYLPTDIPRKIARDLRYTYASATVNIIPPSGFFDTPLQENHISIRLAIIKYHTVPFPDGSQGYLAMISIWVNLTDTRYGYTREHTETIETKCIADSKNRAMAYAYADLMSSLPFHIDAFLLQ